MFKADRIIARLTFILSFVSYAGILAIMLLNVADVFLTKAFRNPISGAYEVTEVLLLCTVMASFAYAQSKKSHIHIVMLIKRLPRVPKFTVYGLMELIAAGVAGAVAYAAVLQAASAMDRGAASSVLSIPLYPFFYVEAVAMGVFALALLYDAVLSFAAIFNDKLQETVTADWS